MALLRKPYKSFTPEMSSVQLQLCVIFLVKVRLKYRGHVSEWSTFREAGEVKVRRGFEKRAGVLELSPGLFYGLGVVK